MTDIIRTPRRRASRIRRYAPMPADLPGPNGADASAATTGRSSIAGRR
ncbi:hypothetical protein EKD16_24785 [Streptomonospora litoralis]|uniref:Uncharacterized protein n=1 Tax=Streptomonospora litoralis TaxID=2498135 RepID=A0A4P6QAS6_9ACTN|nr:hypothetical protein EKD16_24785 [Streptomonospora litoralis]